ncbi:ABC transporter permease [Senegalia massiliensis]|uniref:ABC transporter permease n=1 Tax=Senegalia massiliensis TaxID=1720316 RepID=A0A845QWB6_9CLOT|nr:FtsX-like permease family protein [Senegalia massiliensis]NBI06079.1 ABC transporter permease [Senegalia massiliensis]
MITNYKGITKRYLKSNKKRAILTIVGIILSVSLISSIGLFFKGLQESQVEVAKSTQGSAHLLYENPDNEDIDKIENNPKVGRSGLYTVESEFMIDEKINIMKLLVTDEALELLPTKIEKGSYPEKENEVALEGWLLKYIEPDADIGGIIDINGESYRLVGILEDSVYNQMNLNSSIYTTGDISNQSEKVLLVEISEKANLKKAVDELSSLAPMKVEKNNYLLSLQGAGDVNDLLGLYIALAVIIGIVVISTIAVIYNSFQISVVERIKEFGLLRAVGTTPKQIRKIIVREATLLSSIGVPIGLLFGVIAIYCIDLVFNLIGGENLDFIKLSISPIVLIISGIIGIVSIYISALLPAIFAGRISPLLAISNRKSIKKEKIKRKKSILSKLFKGILGFEGELAYKNIKRNKKRYRVTVFSIVISVVLFISFSSFVNMADNVTDSPTESDNVHFSIVRDTAGFDNGESIEEDIIKEIKNMPSVKTVYKAYNDYAFEFEIDEDSQTGKVKEISEGIAKVGGEKIYNESENHQKIKINGNINIYDENALEVSKKYLKSGDIDIEEINDKNGVIFIADNRIYNYETENSYYGPIADIKSGDEIKVLNRIYWDAKNEEEIIDDINKDLKVMAVAKGNIFRFRGSGGEEGLKIITSKEVAQDLLDKDSIKPINLNIVLNDETSEKSVVTELEKIINDDPNLRVINHIENNRQSKASNLIVKILLYGFVVVVSLIGSVNIINTITTNILLRKREFATLRSIGLTHKGLKKMVVLEGILYGVMGLIYGSIIGSILSFVMYRGMGSVREMQFWNIPWNTIGIATIAIVLIGFLSVQYPLSKIKRDNLIETIKGDY